MKIIIKSGPIELIASLNESKAAKTLWELLPI